MGASLSASAPAQDLPIVPTVNSYTTPGYATYVIYWVIFGIMTGAALIFALWTFKRPQQYDRTHGYITTAIVAIAASAYYSMAAHGGDSYIPQYFNLNVARDVFWARYIDWFLTTPLLLLDVLLLASVPVGTALWIVFADIAMILFGLWGAITDWHFRWGYYAIGCFWMFIVIWGLLFTGPKYAFARDRTLGRVYLFFAAYLSVLWIIYPIAWGFCEGSNTITVTAEAAWYGGLDVTAKVIFGFLVLFTTSKYVEPRLHAERQKGIHNVSLLAAPITAPLSAGHIHHHDHNHHVSPAGATFVPVGPPVAVQTTEVVQNGAQV